MKLTDIYLVTFSPTGTSRKVGEAIVRGLGNTNGQVVDLTYQEAEERVFPQDALTVFALPVYGGHLPPLALERMKGLRSEGGIAVAVVVYGNRAYEHALEQLDAVLTDRGFRVVAGGTFIGEHSYSHDQYPIAPGRPDADDLEYAHLFGEKIRTKVEMAADKEHLYGVDVRKILRPRQPFIPLVKFLYKVVKLRKSGQPLPRTPEVNAEACTHCGACVKACPTGAIVLGDECYTQAEACIRCCACVKRCPQHARSYHTPFAQLLSGSFQREKENRIIL